MPPVYSTHHQRHYYKGHVTAPNIVDVINAKFAQHKDKLQRLRAVVGNPPPSWDSRTHNWIPPIRDQGQCGSCWDFSGTFVATVAFIQAGIWPNDGSKIFSEQYTLDCGRNGGCGGDDNITVLEWAKNKGLAMDSDYGPYHAGRGRCKSGVQLYQIDDWGFASASGGQGVADPLDIKMAIMTHGCVGSGIAADGAFSNIHDDTIFDRNTSRSIDHDIGLCGWGDTATKTISSGVVKALQTSITASDGWWWLRNSWNLQWGIQGYCRIRWGINMVGSEACWATKKAVVPPFIDWSKV